MPRSHPSVTHYSTLCIRLNTLGDRSSLGDGAWLRMERFAIVN